jgi:iron complex outermembrane receptor protein/vitamin B12 transporter
MKRMGLGAVFVFVFAGFSGALPAHAQGVVNGTVVDQLGARVAKATVTLRRDSEQVTQTSSTETGEYSFDMVPAGRYQVEVRADGFEPMLTEAFFVGATGRTLMNIMLSIGPLRQEVVVTAAATEVPASQIGAQVTVVDADTLDRLAKPDLLEALRLVPGAQIVQTGQRGGATSLFVRGGASNFNKVLIDGVPANDIGGGFDFSGVATTGVDRVEVLREANSVLHGTDSLAGVVSILTRRGRSQPELAYSIDGGNLGTVRNSIAVGGAVRRFDYFSEYAYFRTDNDLPNNRYTNPTYAGRFGLALGANTDLSATIRRANPRYESPQAVPFFGIPDDSSQDTDFTYVGVAVHSQINDRLQTTIRFASMEQNLTSENPTPTGEPFDPFGFGANYLGNTVTIRGANGYSVTGRAILDFGGGFPSLFTAHTTRRLISGKASYRVTSALDVSGGGRFEREEGFTQFQSNPLSESERNNGGAFVEGRVSVPRLFVSGGVGFEHNAVFENAASPRLSVAAYLRQPSAGADIGETKVILNAGQGIKAPAIFQELSSLFALVNPAQAAGLGVEAIGPERARNFDVGVEQGLLQGQLRVRATFFHNDFDDLIEFVSDTVLPQLGVSPEAAAATGFGAYVNSQSYRARGLETSADAMIGRRVRAAASYTYLDAKVTESLSGGALAPAINPAFPGIEIGASSPLVGARPFRRPTHSGSLLLSYVQGPAQVTLAGFFSGKQDDSTFLSDEFFGNSMLLPNKDLNAAYQKVDVSGSYRLHPRMKWYASIENLGGEQYQASAGFPALPRTLRTGVTLTLGGSPTP